MSHTHKQVSLARLALVALLAVLLAGCAGLPIGLGPAEPTAAPSGALAPTTAPASVPTAAPVPIDMPTAAAPTDVPTDAAGSAGAPAATDAAASASGADTDAIKQVIQKANQEQQQALAAHDPAGMRDTSTASYYPQAAQGLNDLLSSGVTAIQLVKLDWGPIALQSATTAQATTVETWSTTFADGSTLQEADTNVYTLVNENGAWKVQDDQHPDSRRMQPPPGQPSSEPTPAAPAASGSASQSRNWAGYAATGSDFTAVSGSWTVPNVPAGPTDAADATWIGIGGVNSRDLIQAGTDATVQSGQVSYTAWIETLPQASQPVPLEVRAGDAVSVSIARKSGNNWQISIRNTTTGQTYQKTVSYQSSLSSAEWIEESPTVGRRTLLPLDNFGTVQFTDATATVGGKQETVAQAGGQPITMSGRTGQPLAQPSALGGDGSSFSVSRTGAAAPPVVPGSSGG